MCINMFPHPAVGGRGGCGPNRLLFPMCVTAAGAVLTAGLFTSHRRRKVPEERYLHVFCIDVETGHGSF